MIFAWDRTIVTRPEDEGRVLDGVEQIRPGVRIRSSKYVPEGTALMFNDDVVEALLESHMESFRFDPPRDWCTPLIPDRWRGPDPRSVMKITDIGS